MYVGELMKRRKLSMKEKLSYGMGDFASNLVYQGISIFILFYWTDYAGISAAVAGTILLISRIFDGVIDVVFGNLVDKTKSKYGKARPYLLWLALPFAFSAMITFWTPGTNGIADIIFAFVSYNVTMVIYTAINIPYGVLSVKMTDDQVERGSLGVFRGIGALIGSMLVAIIAPMLIEVVGYTWTFLIIGLVAAASLLVTFKGTEEHVGLTQEDKVTPFKEGFVALLKNKPWLIMLLVGILVFTFSGLKMTSNIYMAKYYFGDESLVGILNVMMMPGMLIGMGVATLLFRRFGKIKTTVFGNLIMFVATVAFYFILFSNPQMTWCCFMDF
ncbi:MFS transporter [Listeria grandensis]|nr:MFS transporter [Listeria grandensis]MBC6316839.1 MFS transporter [Listeria grandensis]